MTSSPPSDPFGATKALAYVVFAALAVRVLWSLALIGMPTRLLVEMRDVFPLVGSVLLFFAVVATMIWLGVLFAAIRKEGGHTGFSPALAALSFVIPFANLVLPPLAMRQAWKARLPHRSEIVIWSYWAIYLVYSIVTALPIRIPVPFLMLGVLLALVGTWGAVVYSLTFGAKPSYAPPPQAWPTGPNYPA